MGFPHDKKVIKILWQKLTTRQLFHGSNLSEEMNVKFTRLTIHYHLYKLLLFANDGLHYD